MPRSGEERELRHEMHGRCLSSRTYIFARLLKGKILQYNGREDILLKRTNCLMGPSLR